MALAALVDAGPLVAVFGANQPQGGRYRALFKQAADEQWSLATTWPCVVEASYLLDVPQRYTLLRWVAAVGISLLAATTGLVRENHVATAKTAIAGNHQRNNRLVIWIKLEEGWITYIAR